MDNQVPKTDIERGNRETGEGIDSANVRQSGCVYREGACGERPCALVGVSAAEPISKRVSEALEREKQPKDDARVWRTA